MYHTKCNINRYRCAACTITIIIIVLGMVHRSERVVQRNFRLQHVFGTSFLIPVPVHGTAVHVVHRAVFLSDRLRDDPGTERNRRLHHYQHHRIYEHCRNGTYNKRHCTLLRTYFTATNARSDVARAILVLKNEYFMAFWVIDKKTKKPPGHSIRDVLLTGASFFFFFW